jgi:hypothetical protein
VNTTQFHGKPGEVDHVRFDQVRSQGTMLVSMLGDWDIMNKTDFLQYADKADR